MVIHAPVTSALPKDMMYSPIVKSWMVGHGVCASIITHIPQDTPKGCGGKSEMRVWSAFPVGGGKYRQEWLPSTAVRTDQLFKIITVADCLANITYTPPDGFKGNGGMTPPVPPDGVCTLYKEQTFWFKSDAKDATFTNRTQRFTIKIECDKCADHKDSCPGKKEEYIDVTVENPPPIKKK